MKELIDLICVHPVHLRLKKFLSGQHCGGVPETGFKQAAAKTQPQRSDRFHFSGQMHRDAPAAERFGEGAETPGDDRAALRAGAAFS